MNRPSELHQKDFEALLALFSRDREEAGQMYERLRRGLVRFFRLKGCDDFDELADETLSRVAIKANSFDAALSTSPTAFVYGFASKIFLEYKRHPRRNEIELDPQRHAPSSLPEPGGPDPDAALERLEKCLSAFPDEDRKLMIRYYGKEKAEKIKVRKRLATELGCEMDALHMRVYRLRRALKKCMDTECAAK